MNSLSKEDTDLINLLTEYIQKIKSHTVSYEEKLNLTEFYVQHQNTVSKNVELTDLGWLEDVVLEWLFQPISMYFYT